MIGALLVLLGFELAGEIVRGLLHLSIPGPVLGMVLLALVLIAHDRGRSPEQTDQTGQIAAATLDTVAGQLIANMGLMFVPAGVGVIAEAHLLRAQWLPIVGGLVGSTILSLLVTGLVMHHATRERGSNATGSAPSELGSLR